MGDETQEAQEANARTRTPHTLTITGSRGQRLKVRLFICPIGRRIPVVHGPSQVSDPNKSMYCHEFQLIFNGPDGPVPVSQAHIPLTAAQIPSFSVMLKNFGPYLPDHAPLAWFKELKHPGPGQPPGTKATFWTTLFEDMLDARDTLVAAHKNVTQRALLNEMGYSASPTKTLQRWLEAMDVSWADFKQWSR